MAIAIPGIEPDVAPGAMDDTSMFDTPAQKFSVEQRATFCGSSDPKSTMFVTEFAIPTECTMPLAVTTTPDGNVWFAQSNTGNIAMFDPSTQNFTEYNNPFWADADRTVNWGMDYSSDGSIWFTDGEKAALWKFDIDTKEYTRVPYPTIEDSLPQRLKILDTQIIVNDFAGNKLDILDSRDSISSIKHTSIESPHQQSFTSDFVIDGDDIWYTNWSQLGGYLIQLDYLEYMTDLDTSDQDLSILDYIVQYQLPAELAVPSSVTIDALGRIWISDTNSSGFYSFDPTSQEFIRYVTAEPIVETYGNKTGVILTPVSRPYWMDTDDMGRIVFNLQTANNIAVMDPRSEMLVEYHIPSRNPAWADCDDGTRLFLGDCGIAQVLDFTVSGELIWFTEWVENNIGVVDTSLALPITINLESDVVTIQSDRPTSLDVTISSESVSKIIISPASAGIDVQVGQDTTSDISGDISRDITLDIVAQDVEPGTYKVLVGAQLDDITVSKFITVTVL